MIMIIIITIIMIIIMIMMMMIIIIIIITIIIIIIIIIIVCARKPHAWVVHAYSRTTKRVGGMLIPPPSSISPVPFPLTLTFE